MTNNNALYGYWYNTYLAKTSDCHQYYCYAIIAIQYCMLYMMDLFSIFLSFPFPSNPDSRDEIPFLPYLKMKVGSAHRSVSSKMVALAVECN